MGKAEQWNEKELDDGSVSRWRLVLDETPEDPRESACCGPASTHERKQSFWDEAEELFGDKAQEAVLALVAGGMVEDKDGAPRFGIERYRHSGDVLALCGEGNFPDRQWDVSTIVGFAGLDSGSLEEFAEKKAGGEAPEKLAEFAKSRIRPSLEDLNMFMSGDVWGVEAEVVKGGATLDSDSIWGFLGRTAAEEAGAELAEGMASGVAAKAKAAAPKGP